MSNNLFGKTPGSPIVRDFQHASRLFVDGDMRLAPKAKFLYQVNFGINSSALKDPSLVSRHQTELAMLVKSVELPKFTVQTETLNEYNRKKVVQVKMDYQPVQVRFHDDNDGVTRKLWENYFTYYYADSTSAKQDAAYKRIAMKSYSFIRTPYGLDNKSKDPFFNHITIYQMGRKQWNSYKLINPVIQAWNHDNLDYSAGGQTGEQNMTLVYEAVVYDSGTITEGSIPSFGLEHYDTTPSPYSLSGQGNNTAGISSVFGKVASALAPNAASEALASAVAATRIYENTKKLNSLTSSISSVTSAAQTAVNGVKDIAFPLNNALGSVKAGLRNILGG